MTEQEIRKRFPISELKFDDTQLRILERFTPVTLYKDGETLVAVGHEIKIATSSGREKWKFITFPVESGNSLGKSARESS